MQSVAVALIDALGFRGIWQHEEPAQIVGALRQYRDMAQQMNERIGQVPGPTMFHAQAVSDTLIFAACAPESAPEFDQRIVELLGVTVGAVTKNAFLHGLPLAFRGYLSLGQGLMEDGILIGEAVDEAAANYERADAACVWLSPRAAEIVMSLPLKSKSGFWVSAAVPIVPRKRLEGEPSSVSTIAVNPCGHTPIQEEHLRIAEGASRAFARGEQSADVARKRSNTMAFLEECSRTAQNWWYSQGYPRSKPSQP